jgi:hypothetical protein
VLVVNGGGKWLKTGLLLLPGGFLSLKYYRKETQ